MLTRRRTGTQVLFYQTDAPLLIYKVTSTLSTIQWILNDWIVNVIFDDISTTWLRITCYTFVMDCSISFTDGWQETKPIIHGEKSLNIPSTSYMNAVSTELWWVQCCHSYSISGEKLSCKWSRCLHLSQRRLITSVLISAVLCTGEAGQHPAEFGSS